MYLSVFALAGILFQISCSNSDDKNAASGLTLSQNKLIYTIQDQSNQPLQIWLSNNDGTNQTLVPVIFPTNVELSTLNNNGSSLKISPDGQKIFFVGFNSVTNLCSVYSCDTNGSNLQEIISPNPFKVIELGGLN